MNRYRIVLILLVAVLASYFSPAQSTDSGVPLWPIYYGSDDGSHVEVAAGLYGRKDDRHHLGPVFWGGNYFNVIPFYWRTGEDWMLFPLAWDREGHRGVGPVWWGDDYFAVAPLLWSEGDNWLMPGAWNWNGHRGAGPIWWGEDYTTVFPFYWQNPNGWTLFPLAWNYNNGSSGVGPVWKTINSSGVFPFYWKNQRGWTLFPLAWNYENGSTGIGPVWWNDQSHGLFPFYWRTGEDWTLLPLAFRQDDLFVVGPVWKDQDTCGVFPLYWKDGADWTLFPFLWQRDDSFTAFPLYWQWKSEEQNNKILFPLAWDTEGSKGIGPVWKSGDKFRIFPLYWKNGEDWTVPPLAWRRDDRHSVLPLYWKWIGQDDASRTVIPPLLGWTEKTEDESSTHALLGMINYKKNEQGKTFEFQPLFKTRSGDVKHFSIFWRLFEYHKDDNESFYRFLFLPKKFGRKLQ